MPQCGAILIDGDFEYHCRKRRGHGPRTERDVRTWHEDRAWLRNDESRTRMAQIVHWSGIPVPDPDSRGESR